MPQWPLTESAYTRKTTARCWLASAIAELVRPGATSRREGPRVNVPNDVARLEVMTDALRALTQERPVLLWLDDLQWGAEAVTLASRLVRGAVRLGVAPPLDNETPDEPTDVRPPCPCCGGHMVIIETFERWRQPRAPPHSTASTGTTAP